MSIIILEGCDASGKDTLGEYLAEQTGYKLIRGSSFEIAELGSDGMFEYMMELLNQDNIIINRFMYSNLVYGAIFNYPMMTPVQYDRLVDRLDEDSLVVYLYAPKGTISYRMQNRGDDMIKVENIDDILKGYSEELYGHYRPSALLSLDTSTFSTKRMSEIIEKLI